MKPNSQNSLAKTDDLSLDDESVASYLLEHPDFFENQEDLLLSLRIPHKSGQAISLLERQVSLLRRRSDETQDQINNFVENAKENDDLFEKTRTIVLNIINTTSLEDLSTLIEEKLKQEFDASSSKLFFATEEDKSEAAKSTLFLLPLELTRKVLGKLFQRKRAYCGGLNEDQATLFFPESSDINSVAIIPIHFNDENTLKEKLPGVPLLVVASSKDKHFNASLDTLFLDFIGEILSAHIKGLLLK
ncbi:MAG: hypothetical protein COA71_02105 [SAR86 cluster bacterium]|uniref:DUF484 family protein n=1 Tax=SAR86 cluster bacterium TaxID=2030880 RepID=A0A2A5CIH6_9GAMM|nr:MAG: hypothetical protein COA71_02105 [SAR86 cluster bacterium]